MILFSEVITTFAFELKRYEKTEMWKFQSQTEMISNAAHAWDYCTLIDGNSIPHSVGYCLLLV